LPNKTVVKPDKGGRPPNRDKEEILAFYDSRVTARSRSPVKDTVEQAKKLRKAGGWGLVLGDSTLREWLRDRKGAGN